MSSVDEPYLEPYVAAARKFGAGFGSLLWASPSSQRARFQAIRQMHDPAGRRILDVGCGRADYLAFLYEVGDWPESYVGIEGVHALAGAAEMKRLRNTKIIRADFVREPARLFVGAELVIFSGSLNTLTDGEFYSTLRRAYDAAGMALIFNFLSSSYLAGQEYLFWRRVEDVLRFSRDLCGDVRMKQGYLQGDCTACLLKPGDPDIHEAVHA